MNGYINTVKRFAEGNNKKISKAQMKKYKNRRKKQEEIDRQKEEKARIKQEKKISSLLEEATIEEKKELDDRSWKCKSRKALLQEIRNANEQGALLDPKIYVLCFNLYLYHPEMIDVALLELIMKGLKLTQKQSDYERYKNTIKSVIRNELEPKFELSFDEE